MLSLSSTEKVLFQQSLLKSSQAFDKQIRCFLFLARLRCEVKVMLPTELGGTRSVQFTRRACLTFCSRLGHPALGPLFFSPSCIPGNEEAFEVAEWKLIPNHGPLGLPAKIGLMQLIFTQIHLSACSPSLPAPGTKSFGSFLCQFMYSFYPPLSSHFLCESELASHCNNCHQYFKDIRSLFQMGCSSSQG